MNKLSGIDKLVLALSNKNALTDAERCELLIAECGRLRDELKQQYIKNYLLECELKPKKRGRKPNPKQEQESPTKENWQATKVFS